MSCINNEVQVPEVASPITVWCADFQRFSIIFCDSQGTLIDIHAGAHNNWRAEVFQFTGIQTRPATGMQELLYSVMETFQKRPEFCLLLVQGMCSIVPKKRT